MSRRQWGCVLLCSFLLSSSHKPRHQWAHHVHSSSVAASALSPSVFPAFLASLAAFFAAAAAFFSSLVSFLANRGSGSLDGLASSSPPPLPSMRGLEEGGVSPGAKDGGTRAAVPEPPPDQPSMGQSHTIPSEGAPPTFAFLITISSPEPSFTVAPTVAMTTYDPSFTFGAFVTTGTGSEAPMSTVNALSLSFPATGSTERTLPTL
mmetsp:Transcript_19414/g.23214  ORF Transcript_19414/g.23214 Transcript_19414/m.23214 type:complete len:206 (+) Transcript_19414:136-753(+)